MPIRQPTSAEIDQIIEKVLPTYQRREQAGFEPIQIRQLRESIEKRKLWSVYTGESFPCPAGVSASGGPKLLGTGAKLAPAVAGGIAGIGAATSVSGLAATAGVTGTGAGTAAGVAAASTAAIVAAPIAIAALIWGIFSKHHAEAVFKENATLCQVVPTVNGILADFDRAFEQGKLSKLQALQALDELNKKVKQALRNIEKRNPEQCNAACVYDRMFEAQVYLREVIYVEPTFSTLGLLGGVAAVGALGGIVVVGGIAAMAGLGALVAAKWLEERAYQPHPVVKQAIVERRNGNGRSYPRSGRFSEGRYEVL